MKALLFHISITFLYGLVLPSKFYAQQLSFKLYNVDNGLPAASVFGAYQDKNGYLWISSATGVSRFDGRQFINYSLADGLPSLHVNTLFQDSRKRLWVATAAGMAEFKNNRFITYPTNDKQNNINVFNFAETKDQRLWMLTAKGAYEYADSVWKKLSLYPGFENNICRNIVEFNQELYVCYPTDIVCRTKNGKWLHIASSKDFGSAFNVMSVQNNEIWISTVNNIYIIRNHQPVPVFKKNLNTTNYFSYLVDSRKRLWLQSENLLQISKPEDWQHFSFSKATQYGNPSLMNEDMDHNVWIGSIQGLLRIKDMSFTTINQDKAVLLNEIYNIMPLPANRLLLSCGSKTGLVIYSNNRYQHVMPPHSAANENYYKDPVDFFSFGKKNSLWMLTRLRKFFHFNNNKLEDFSAPLKLKTTAPVYDMKYVKSRDQFFICADSTLLYGNAAGFSTFIPRNTGVPVIKPTTLYEMKNGLLMIYIDGAGVYCIDESNNLISLVKETGIDGSKKGIEPGIFFYEDSRNNLWISSPGLGLYEYGFANNKLPFLKVHFTTKDGLQSNNIVCITNDLQNRLWIATTTGLDILQKNKADKWEVFNYAKAEELTLTRSDYERLVTDPVGNVFLSTPDKILKFNTAKIHLLKKTPNVIIEKVTLAFKETDWSKVTDSLYSYYQLPYNPVLDYDENSLGIFFNAIDFSTSNSNPEYSYKLVPFNTSWSIPSKIKSVSFAELPPGKYEFMVRAKDGASGWSQPDVFRFTITPPYWNRWWFRLVVIAVAFFIVVSIFRARIQKIKQELFIQTQLKELEMKALKAQMNPHFIYNALNSIQALVADDKKQEGIFYIGSFSRLLKQVLSNSEDNVISLDKELETVGLYIELEALRLDMHLQYTKIVDQDVVPEFEKIPPLILQPFVENALWHGLSRKEGEKEIKISVSTNENWLICHITDNGIGRQKAQELKNDSIGLHQSKAIDITQKRLIDFNENDFTSPVEFVDLYDTENNPCGTMVILHIKRKSSEPSVWTR